MPDITITHLALLATSGLTFCTTVAGFVYTWFRDERRHRWALEREIEHRQLTEAMAAQLADLHKALK